MPVFAWRKQVAPTISKLGRDEIIYFKSQALSIIEQTVDAISAEYNSLQQKRQSSERKQRQQAICLRDFKLAQHGLVQAKNYVDPVRANNILEQVIANPNISRGSKNRLLKTHRLFLELKNAFNTAIEHIGKKEITPKACVSLMGFAAWSPTFAERLKALGQQVVAKASTAEIIEPLDKFPQWNSKSRSTFVEHVSRVLDLQKSLHGYMFYSVNNLLRNNSALEHLQFITAVTLYNKMPNDEYKESAFADIYEKFIHPSAQCFIKVSDSIYHEIAQAYAVLACGSYVGAEPPSLDLARDEVLEKIKSHALTKKRSNLNQEEQSALDKSKYIL